MIIQKIKYFFFGKYSRRYYYGVLLPITFIIFFGLLIIARLFYPGDYFFLTNPISDLGNHILNPFPGWFFFSLAFWFFSLLYLPLFLYLHKRLVRLQPIKTKIGSYANSCSVLGTILLGIFPNQPESILMHNIAAGLSFGGISIALSFYWLVVIEDSIKKALQYHHIGILMVLIFITFILAAIAFFAVFHIYNNLFGAHLYIIQIFGTRFFWLFRFPFWEWTLFIILAAQLIFIGLIVPEQFSGE